MARYWEWALGCLTAELLVVNRLAQWSSWTRFSLLLLGSYGLTLATAFLPHPGSVLAHVRPPMFAAIVFVGARLPPLRSGLYRFALAGGLQSYSLYLTHPIAIPLVCILLATLDAPLWVQWMGAFVASGLLCALFFRTVERPFLERSSKMRAQSD